ncbi:hypothetical protein TIFTF001_000284 [Ficus carica]|uniref:Plastocyanin-like domain-containing protein n=1 Tax=Ficus carica TaxID=3494 RepID=A0AA87ZFM8_FICCA|nr:hypothetical protein TIFTF001_000284 [Ficus carica]
MQDLCQWKPSGGRYQQCHLCHAEDMTPLSPLSFKFISSTSAEFSPMIFPGNRRCRLITRGLKDQKKFNLVDPIERNTVGVPSGGWTAISDSVLIIQMAFVVDNGKGPNESLLPPPTDLPKWDKRTRQKRRVPLSLG